MSENFDPTIHWIDQRRAEMDIMSAADQALRGEFYALHNMTPEDFASDPARVMIRILTLIGENELLKDELRTAKGTIARIEADRLELVAEVERLKIPLKKLVRVWRYGDSDESLLNHAEEIVKDAEQALNPKSAEQPPK
jgi:hypothetical protein